MAFYIKPPSGIEQLRNLAVFCKKRLTFLKQVLKCDGSAAFRGLLVCADTVDESECLIEGTWKDRVSHFLLRLACCQDLEMAKFFVKAETELFCYRFASMNSMELVHLLQSTHHFLLRLCQHQAKRNLQTGWGWHGSRTSCSNLFKMLQGMIADGLTWTYIITKYLDGCRSEVIKVPFEYALSLVAQRSVVLETGMAWVPYADILKVFAFLFEQLISDGMAESPHLVQDIAANDERMVELFRDIRQLYYAGSRITGVEWASQSVSVAGDDINHLSTCFPPCMQHLHGMLRKKHRLRHFSRIQYTLFLKEVGLPVSDAVKFWQREYSQPDCSHGDSVGCTHNWKKDGRRYTYNIRHLYGLEGSRVNYRAHSCRSIQERSIGHGEEGGCPFQHFDDLHLRNIMSQAGIMSEMDQTQIIDIAVRGEKQTACQKFFTKSVAVNLGRLLKATPPTLDTGNHSDEKDVDEEDVGETDLDFQPCNKKKLRLERDSLGEMFNNETRVGRSPSRDSVNKASTYTKRSSEESVPREPTVKALQALNQVPDCKTLDFTGGGSVSSAISEVTLPEGHLQMYNEDAPKTFLRIPGDSNEDESRHTYSEGGSARSSAISVSSASKEQLPMDGAGNSNITLISPDDLNEDAPSSRLITALKDVQIQKPVDYYRSYIQLMGSLTQPDGSKS